MEKPQYGEEIVAQDLVVHNDTSGVTKENPFQSQQQEELIEAIRALQPKLEEVNRMMLTCTEAQREALRIRHRARVWQLGLAITGLAGALVVVQSIDASAVNWQNTVLGATLGMLGFHTENLYGEQAVAAGAVIAAYPEQQEKHAYTKQHLSYDIELLINEVRADIDAGLEEGGASYEQVMGEGGVAHEELIATPAQKTMAAREMHEDLAKRMESEKNATA